MSQPHDRSPADAPPPEDAAKKPRHHEHEGRVIEALRTVFDPEIPVNIYDLGLVYEVEVDLEGKAYVQMTLTSPACPVAGSLPGEVETRVRSVEGVTDATIDLVWDPPWTPAKLSEAARLQLGMM
jgi:FeS assembly SUF system protein